METEEMARKLALAESSFKAALEVLSKRSQFFVKSPSMACRRPCR